MRDEHSIVAQPKPARKPAVRLPDGNDHRVTSAVTGASYKGEGLRCDGGRGRQGPMSQGQPAGEMVRRLVRGFTVERHHCRWHPGAPLELSAPAVADRHDLYQVRAPANGLFEAMNRHVCVVRM